MYGRLSAYVVPFEQDRFGPEIVSASVQPGVWRLPELYGAVGGYSWARRFQKGAADHLIFQAVVESQRTLSAPRSLRNEGSQKAGGPDLAIRPVLRWRLGGGSRSAPVQERRSGENDPLVF